ncbi:EAL domain-containing protein [Proteiniclasticum sp. C24MP]|uniref:EAL domain-containing protein n=1 Tax=Proteiniclasticum sp. C24MP TaxID=3374101 RepID=UPI0037540198
MMESGVLSVIFYGSLILYFYMGMYLFSLDIRDRIHRIFFYLCLSLSIWSLTSSLLGHVESRDMAFVTLLVSVWGWGFAYSFLLHLVLLIMKMDRGMKPWHWLAIYAPVPVNMILFYGNLLYSNVSDNMLLSQFGWSYERTELAAFLWIRVLYLSVMAVILILLYRGKREEDDLFSIREMKLIKATMILSLLLGLPKIFELYEAMGWNLLGLGPLHLLPVCVTLFIVMKLKDMKRQDSNIALPRRGELMSIRTHEKIFFYVSQGYILGAFTAFGIEVLLKRDDIVRAGILSFTLFATGIVIFLILKSRLSIRIRDNILFLIIAMSIPYITFYQIENSEAFAWTVPVIFILIAVIFNNTKLLVSISIMTIITSKVLWIVRPESVISFSPADHLGRMIVFGIIIIIAFLINRVYKNRQYQFEKQIDHEKFVSETARLLSSARNRNLRSNLDVFLERSLHYMDADYGSIHIFPERKKKMRKAEYYGPHDFVNPGINHRFGERFDEMVESLLEENSLYTEKFFTTLKEFSEEMRKEGITVMVTPLVESGKILGVMCMSSFVRNSWDEGYQNTFQLVAGSLSSMLYKIGKEDELFRMAYYDHLTGLPNRVLYEKIIRKHIHGTRENEMLALIFLDLDDFKNINDILGHSTGDRFLKEFAKKLKPKLKERDLLSRFGGDEFLLMLPHAKSMEEIENFAEDVLQEIMKPFLLDDREVITGASMGVSIYPQDGRTGEELIKFADLAMYHSKSTGKNRFTVCTEEIKKKFVYEKELEEDLRHAVEKDQFVLYYQPKVHGKTEEIIGAEALIRWKHPTRGLLAPGVFLPIAERTGLMEEIDTWVFIEACRQNMLWQQKGYRKISMSINITPISMMQSDMGRDLAEVFKENGWDPEYIEAEITENTMVFSLDQIQSRLSSLRDIGIRISLDDFGTAYSSLSRLHELPIDKVKIDRQFILNLHHEDRGKNLYDGILDLARSLDLVVIIEGVETRDQADYVREKGCDEIQGFYYYKPMPPEQMEKLLQQMDGTSMARVMSPDA